ncbi:type II toxin-antitoxin system RelB/ParD family antitoxin [Lactovum odontotermitis]
MVSYTEKNTQFNFRTNSDLLAEARKIVNDENFDMTTIMNSVLTKIVEEHSVPAELISEKEARRKKIIDSLYAEINIGRKSALAGKTKPLSEVMSKYGL